MIQLTDDETGPWLARNMEVEAQLSEDSRELDTTAGDKRPRVEGRAAARRGSQDGDAVEVTEEQEMLGDEVSTKAPLTPQQKRRKVKTRSVPHIYIA